MTPEQHWLCVDNGPPIRLYARRGRVSAVARFAVRLLWVGLEIIARVTK